MSDKITRKDLDRMAEICQREAPVSGYTYAIEYAYGRPVLALQDKTLCGRNVSPRLPKGQLAAWICAFLEGVRASSRQQDEMRAACRAVVDWAKTPREARVGNPYCMPMVRACMKAVGDPL